MPTERPRGTHRRRSCLGTAVFLIVATLLGVYGVGAVLIPRLTPATCRVTVGDATVTYDPEQMQNAATITAIAVRRDLPRRAATIALATALQESKLRNLDHGDRDSLGLFQQRPSQGWGSPEEVRDPVYATERFYDALVEVDGYEDRPLTEVAQDVQRSGHPDAYAQHEHRADVLSRAFTGAAPAAVTCRLDEAASTGSASSVADALEEELGLTPTTRQDALVAVTSDETLAWAAAHWAVAHAHDAGITSVRVGDRTWTRGKGAEAGRWTTTNEDRNPTDLRITLGPSGREG